MNKKILALVTSLFSLGAMGLNPVGACNSDHQSVNNSSELQVNYDVEQSFVWNMRLALTDICLRLGYGKNDESGEYSNAQYTAKLDNGESIMISAKGRTFYDPGFNSQFRSIIDQFIPLLEKNNILLPSSDVRLAMTDEFKGLIKTWKDNGIYDSKMNEIVGSFLDSLSIGENEKRNVVNFSIPSIPDYNENIFSTNLRFALCDIANRLETPFAHMRSGYPKYVLQLANGENIDLVSPKKMEDTTMFHVYRYMIDQGISILDKNNILLPTLSMGLYMPDEARELIKKWKDQGIYDEKINSIIMSFMDSYHTWEWTEDDKKYSPDKPDPKDDKERDVNKNDFKEETFVRSMNLTMDDIMTRISLESFTNGKLDYKYDANLANGESVALKYRRTADSLKEMLRSIIDQGISLLDKSPLFLPSSNNFVYMPHGARDLLNQWKNDGIYDSKIDDMIKSYVDQFFSIAVDASKMQEQQSGTEK